MCVFVGGEERRALLSINCFALLTGLPTVLFSEDQTIREVQLAHLQRRREQRSRQKSHETQLLLEKQRLEHEFEEAIWRIQSQHKVLQDEGEAGKGSETEHVSDESTARYTTRRPGTVQTISAPTQPTQTLVPPNRPRKRSISLMDLTKIQLQPSQERVVNPGSRFALPRVGSPQASCSNRPQSGSPRSSHSPFGSRVQLSVLPSTGASLSHESGSYFDLGC